MTRVAGYTERRTASRGVGPYGEEYAGSIDFARVSGRGLSLYSGMGPDPFGREDKAGDMAVLLCCYDMRQTVEEFVEGKWEVGVRTRKIMSVFGAAKGMTLTSQKRQRSRAQIR